MFNSSKTCIFAEEMNPLILHIEEALRSTVPADELRDTAFYIAEEVTGLSRTELLCGKGTTISTHAKTQLENVLARVRQHEPLQYIFGTTDWRGMRLHVSPAVLIPRPETAELVDWVIEEEARNKKQEVGLHVIDCGTGSGCIAIALRQARSDWHVTGLDISEEALQIAQKNALAQEATVHFQRLDLLTEDLPECDIIVSNPPYIRMQEQADMAHNVLDYEPYTALFVSDSDPLLFYRRIAAQKKARVIYFEINQYLAVETIQMLQDLGYTTTLRQDIFGNNRMLRAVLI